jgi:hypothetical protein
MADNPKDPLKKIGPDASRELFRRLGQEANGFPADAVVDAAVNVLINALRQSNATRAQAERAFDDMFGRAKAILVDHYDMLGRKRGIFPYDQVITVPHSDFRRKH